jgi:hypothetical protein
MYRANRIRISELYGSRRPDAAINKQGQCKYKYPRSNRKIKMRQLYSGAVTVWDGEGEEIGPLFIQLIFYWRQKRQVLMLTMG